MEVPKGESDKDDISFSIAIEIASKTFHIRVGEWQHFDYAGKKEDTDNSVVIAYGEWCDDEKFPQNYCGERNLLYFCSVRID